MHFTLKISQPQINLNIKLLREKSHLTMDDIAHKIKITFDREINDDLGDYYIKEDTIIFIDRHINPKYAMHFAFIVDRIIKYTGYVVYYLYCNPCSSLDDFEKILTSPDTISRWSKCLYFKDLLPVYLTRNKLDKNYVRLCDNDDGILDRWE